MASLHLVHGRDDPGPIDLDPDRAAVLREAMLGAVTALSAVNGTDRRWWYTWLASRDRFNARLWDRLVWLARLEARLAAGDSDLTLACPDPLLARPATEMARRAGWACRLSPGLALRARLAPLAGLATGWLAWARHLGRLAREFLAARRHPHPAAPDAPADVLLFTQLTAPPLKRPGAYVDTYFGDLATRLLSAGERVAVVGGTGGDPNAVCAALAARPEAIASFAHLTGLRDILAAARDGIAWRGRVPAWPLPWGGDGSPLLADDLMRARGYVAECVLVERAALAAFRRHPQARAIAMYENNPWEHAVAVAARASGCRSLLGYLHCAVLPSHLKNHIAREEAALRPAPDAILCTGEEARLQFLALGHHDPARVRAACSLRGPDFSDLPVRERAPGRVRRLVALLEGLPSMIHFLRFLDQAAAACPDLVVLVRGHPTLPVTALAERAGVSFGDGARLRPSVPADLVAALAEADAVVYQGTTAAMTALAMGIPVVKARMDRVLDDDPLSACRHLKRVVDRPEDLAPALASLAALDADSFAAERGAARAWVLRVMTPPGADCLRAFQP